jgi:hypothetical protein
MWFVTTAAGQGIPPRAPLYEASEGERMRAETELRIRVSKRLKDAWQARAREDGVSLSHVIRTAGRLGMILGPARLHESVSKISAIRRDLQAANAELIKLATAAPAVEPGRLRAAVASVHEAADATATFLRQR